MLFGDSGVKMDSFFLKEEPMPQVSLPSVVESHCVAPKEVGQDVHEDKSEVHAHIEEKDDVANAFVVDNVEEVPMVIVDKEMEGCLVIVNEAQRKLEENVVENDACGEVLKVQVMLEIMEACDDACGPQLVNVLDEKESQEDALLCKGEDSHALGDEACDE